MVVISVILFALAAICNAVMDICSHHYSSSIFTRFNNENWWNAAHSWRNKYVKGDPNQGRVKGFWGYNKPVQITDAWHFFKMLMIIFLAASVATSNSASTWYYQIIIVAAYGFLWNSNFSLFYNHILKK